MDLGQINTRESSVNNRRSSAMKGRPAAGVQVNGSSNGTHVDSSTETEPETPMYLAAHPKKKSSIAALLRSGQPTKIEAAVEEYKNYSWQQKLSMCFVAIFWRIGTVLALVGVVIEWTLNLLHLNNGPFSLLYKLFLFQWGKFHANLCLIRCKKTSEKNPSCFLCAEI